MIETAISLRSTCRGCGGSEFAPYGVRGGFTLERCLKCQLIFVREEMPAGFVEEFYNGKGCDSYVRQDEEVRPRINLLLDQLAEMHPPGRRVLDVGCGAGMFLQEAVKRGYECRGIDADPCRVEFCRKLGLDVIEGILPHPALSGRQFDVIWMSHVIEHVPDAAEFLREVTGLLGPGGILCVLTPNIRSVASRVCRTHSRYVIPPEHLTYWSREALVKSANQAGLRAERVYAAEGQLQFKEILAHVIKLRFLTPPPATPPAKRFVEGRGETARLAYRALVGLDRLAAPVLARMGGCELRGFFRKAA